MSSTYRAACIQFNAGNDIAKNIETLSCLIRKAAADGAKIILTPENSDFLSYQSGDRDNLSQKENAHPALPFFSSLAKELSVCIIAGSLHIKLQNEKLANRSYVFLPDGKIQNTYDKIHLFDVDIPGGHSYRESDHFEGGSEIKTAEYKSAKIGLSICYDLRFPHLYRKLAKLGAHILSVPAAFTYETGQKHWEVLLRARAIETGCYVIAAGQTGTHPGERNTWGHSMIINPWGEIITSMKEETGFITADIKLDDVAKFRNSIPSLKHDIMF